MDPVWLNVEEIKPFPLSPCDQIYTHAASVVKELLGKPIPGFAFHYQEYGIEFLIADEDRMDLGNRILDRIADRAFTDRVVSAGLAACEKLLELAEPFSRSKTFSNAELADRFEAYLAALGKSMGYGYLGNLLDYASDDVDNVLVEKLEETVFGKVENRREAINVLLALTTPEETTYPNQEHREFLNVAIDVLSNPDAKKILVHQKSEVLKTVFEEKLPKLANRVRAHQEKWAWLSFLFVGPAKWTLSYFYVLLSGMAKSGENPLAERKRLEHQPAQINAARKKAENVVPDDAYFYAARRLSYLKAMRKDAQVHSYYYLDGFYKHLARTFGLSITQARFHTSQELLAILRGRAEPNPSLANARFKHCFFSTYRGRVDVVHGEAAAQKAKAVRRPALVQSDEVRGSCACPGQAVGIVKIVNTVEEASKVNAGDVLVSYATNPELVSAMRKASAIVTDMGGLTCHAAIVARELDKPCVIGTKHATRVFKDGERVKVDADNGRVIRLDFA